MLDVMISSRAASLGRNAPPRNRPLWELGVIANKADLDVFLKRIKDVPVVDVESEARLRRVCKAVDTDVRSSGGNLLFYLTATFKKGAGVALFKQVLSLGVRPDVPN